MGKCLHMPFKVHIMYASYQHTICHIYFYESQICFVNYETQTDYEQWPSHCMQQARITSNKPVTQVQGTAS